MDPVSAIKQWLQPYNIDEFMESYNQWVARGGFKAKVKVYRVPGLIEVDRPSINNIHSGEDTYHWCDVVSVVDEGNS